MRLLLHSLRFHLTAVDAVHFPAGIPGNVLRGALGLEFRKQVCDPDCPGPAGCEIRRTCPYARFFEPSATGGGPSGLADWPRPFVFRAGHLDGATVPAGSEFHFDLNLFVVDESAIGHFTRAFAQVAADGLGPRRGRSRLDAADQMDLAGAAIERVFDAITGRTVDAAPPLTLDLSPPADPVGRVCVVFRTPTELKAGETLAEKPEFRVLLPRCRDRVSALCTLYQHHPLQIDFQAMGRRADAVKMTRCEIQWRDISRRSSRTGQTHPIGGFVGTAEYEGNLAEFLPFLNAAQWTGVGRHTVWGKGAIQVERI